MQKYRKVKVIGKGSFGNAVLVSLANDRKKQFVMKVKLCENSNIDFLKIIDISRMNKKDRNNALEETNILKKLNHPFIVKQYESFIEKK